MASYVYSPAALKREAKYAVNSAVAEDGQKRKMTGWQVELTESGSVRIGAHYRTTDGQTGIVHAAL